jgi:hypothetical protein
MEAGSGGQKGIEGSLEGLLVETAPAVYTSPVAILFGEGHNDASFVDASLAVMAAQYGLSKTQGLVHPLIFPGDFPNGRISLLPDMLKDFPVRALVLVGAPEGTHRALARLQDAWQDALTAYPVVSILPKDDTLGIESGSDLVLDYGTPPNGEVGGIEAEEERTLSLVMALLEFFSKSEIRERPPEELPTLILQSLGDFWTAKPWKDPATGIPAANHFVLTRVNQ